MAANVDPLVVARIIGDVVDMFVPSVNMRVEYGSKQFYNGSNIKPSIAIHPPAVTISGHSHQLYTLVMTDPDAPSPSEPSLREWVQWIVTDIHGCSTNTSGKVVIPYTGPTPHVGIHRYIFVLFQQKAPLGFMNEHHILRPNFNTRAFAHHVGLGLPVASVYFNSQREPAKRRHR